MIRFTKVRRRRRGREVTTTVVGPEGDESFDLFFRSDGVPLDASPEALITLALPVAMAKGVGIEVPGRVDPDFLASVDRWQQVFAAWFPGRLTPVEIVARTRRPRGRKDGVAAFFTSGVDSTYTVLKHLERIDSLIYVWGYDIPLELTPALRQRVAAGVRAAADEFGKPLVEIETNLREWSDRQQSAWGMLYSGVAIAAVGHLLARRFGEVLMGSHYVYRDIFAWASTPLTDAMLVSDRSLLVHDGCEADRVDRVAALAESAVAMRHLRVCWENRHGAYNCGECTKCVRTMIALRICGALERCETLPDLDVDTVADLTHTFVAVLPRFTELVEHLRANDDDPELLDACERVLRAIDPSEIRWDLDFRDIMPLLFEP